MDRDWKILVDGTTGQRGQKDNYRLYFGHDELGEMRAVYMPWTVFRTVVLLALQRDVEGGWVLPQDLTSPTEYARIYLARAQEYVRREFNTMGGPESFTDAIGGWQVFKINLGTTRRRGLFPVRLNVDERSVWVTRAVRGFDDFQVKSALVGFLNRHPSRIIQPPGVADHTITITPGKGAGTFDKEAK